MPNFRIRARGVVDSPEVVGHTIGVVLGYRRGGVAPHAGAADVLFDGEMVGGVERTDGAAELWGRGGEIKGGGEEVGE